MRPVPAGEAESVEQKPSQSIVALSDGHLERLSDVEPRFGLFRLCKRQLEVFLKDNTTSVGSGSGTHTRRVAIGIDKGRLPNL